MTTAPDLRTRLEGSRAALLLALEGLTDREFGAEIQPGVTVIGVLARLAPAERAAVDAARVAAGMPPHSGPIAAGALLTRAVPPQVIHDLAGARHGTLTFIEGLQPEHLGSTTPDGQSALALLAAIVEREEAAAHQIAALPRGGVTPA